MSEVPDAVKHHTKILDDERVLNVEAKVVRPDFARKMIDSAINHGVTEITIDAYFSGTLEEWEECF